jgi:hypothetical protein
MIKFMNTFGLFTNVGIILFADNTIVNRYTVEQRWQMMFYFENFLLITVFFFKLNFIPNWFGYAEKAKLSYLITSMNTAELAQFRQEKKQTEDKLESAQINSIEDN